MVSGVSFQLSTSSLGIMSPPQSGTWLPLPDPCAAYGQHDEAFLSSRLNSIDRYRNELNIFLPPAKLLPRVARFAIMVV